MKNAAKYNNLVEFWIPQNVPDGIGGSYVSYVLAFSDYARITAKDQKRTLQENQLVFDGYYQIDMRYRSDINVNAKKTIIKSDGQYFTIQSVTQDFSKDYKLICSNSDQIAEIFENENPYTQPYTPPTSGGNTLPFILA